MNSTEKLIAYCTGALSSEDRLEVEEQLLSSKAFVSQFISVKRALEAGEAFEVVPSSALKSKLRREIERSFGKAEAQPSWLHSFALKPALGVAFALLAVLGSTVVFLNKSTPTPPELKNGISVDAVNALPINFNVL